MRNKASWLVRTVAGVSLMAGASAAIGSDATYQDGYRIGYNTGYRAKTEEIGREEEGKLSRYAIGGIYGAVGFLAGAYVSCVGILLFTKKGKELEKQLTPKGGAPRSRPIVQKAPWDDEPVHGPY